MDEKFEGIKKSLNGYKNRGHTIMYIPLPSPLQMINLPMSVLGSTQNQTHFFPSFFKCLAEKPTLPDSAEQTVSGISVVVF